MKKLTSAAIGSLTGLCILGVAYYFIDTPDACKDIIIKDDLTTTVLGKKCVYKNKEGITVRSSFFLNPELYQAYASAAQAQKLTCQPNQPCTYYVPPETGLELKDPKSIDPAP